MTAAAPTITLTTRPTLTLSPLPPTPTKTAAPTSTVTATPSLTPDRQITLMAVGDIMLGRTIAELIANEGPAVPFQYTAETLASADITIGNLECVISDLGVPEKKTYTFRAPPAAVESLTLAGFDLVSLANNHTLDFGRAAFEDTLNRLSDQGILTVGGGVNEASAYAPTFIEKDGLKVAFLAYTEVPIFNYDYFQWLAGPDTSGITWAYKHIIERDVRAARAQADLVVVLFHNGYEGMQRPSELQQTSARLAIDSGAALVIGSHPHVLQTIESYQNGLIVYSMGNFVFDQFGFPANYSGILSVTLSPEGVLSYEIIDVVIQANGLPQIMPYD
jgi:poly-gamma-glutamate synthesis protein (capsule biosynthesis protein)